MRDRQVERTTADRRLFIEAEARVGHVRLLDAGEKYSGPDGHRRDEVDRHRTRGGHRAVRGVLIERRGPGGSRSGIRIDSHPVGRRARPEELEVHRRDLGRGRGRERRHEISRAAGHADAAGRRRSGDLVRVEVERLIQRPGFAVVRGDVVRGNGDRDGVAADRARRERRERHDRLADAGRQRTGDRLSVRKGLGAGQVERHGEAAQRVGALVGDDRLNRLGTDERPGQRTDGIDEIDARVVEDRRHRRRQARLGTEIAGRDRRRHADAGLRALETVRQPRVVAGDDAGRGRRARPAPVERDVQRAPAVGERRSPGKRQVKRCRGIGERRGCAAHEGHAGDRGRPGRALEVGRIRRVLEVDLQGAGRDGPGSGGIPETDGARDGPVDQTVGRGFRRGDQPHRAAVEELRVRRAFVRRGRSVAGQDGDRATRHRGSVRTRRGQGQRDGAVDGQRLRIRRDVFVLDDGARRAETQEETTQGAQRPDAPVASRAFPPLSLRGHEHACFRTKALSVSQPPREPYGNVIQLVTSPRRVPRRRSPAAADWSTWRSPSPFR